jgi:hypothetical protein
VISSLKPTFTGNLDQQLYFMGITVVNDFDTIERASVMDSGILE